MKWIFHKSNDVNNGCKRLHKGDRIFYRRYDNYKSNVPDKAASKLRIIPCRTGKEGRGWHVTKKIIVSYRYIVNGVIPVRKAVSTSLSESN